MVLRPKHLTTIVLGKLSKLFKNSCQDSKKQPATVSILVKGDRSCFTNFPMLKST